jgi:hypothetical protein
MISRVTAFATTFAVLAAATLTFATAAQQPSVTRVPQAKQVRVVQLDTVTVIGHRSGVAQR